MDTQKSGIHKTESRFRAGSESQREWIRKLIAPTVRWIAAQDRALIRQALGEEADQVLDALAAGTEELEDTVCQRVEALLPELLRGEVHRVIEEAISGVEGMLAGPLDHGGQSVKALRSRGQIAGPVGGWGDTAEDDDKGPSGGDDTETAFVSAGLTRHQASERLGASRPVEADAPAELLSQEFEAILEAGGEFEGHAPGEDGDGHPASWATDARLYEGTVILLLEATTGIGQVIQFLRDLCMKPAIRLLKIGRQPWGARRRLGGAPRAPGPDGHASQDRRRLPGH